MLLHFQLMWRILSSARLLSCLAEMYVAYNAPLFQGSSQRNKECYARCRQSSRTCVGMYLERVSMGNGVYVVCFLSDCYSLSLSLPFHCHFTTGAAHGKVFLSACLFLSLFLTHSLVYILYICVVWLCIILVADMTGRHPGALSNFPHIRHSIGPVVSH